MDIGQCVMSHVNGTHLTTTRDTLPTLNILCNGFTLSRSQGPAITFHCTALICPGQDWSNKRLRCAAIKAEVSVPICFFARDPSTTLHSSIIEENQDVAMSIAAYLKPPSLPMNAFSLNSPQLSTYLQWQFLSNMQITVIGLLVCISRP